MTVDASAVTAATTAVQTQIDNLGDMLLKFAPMIIAIAFGMYGIRLLRGFFKAR